MSRMRLPETIFQSTPSVGRATIGVCRSRQRSRHFNPRPPWGGRRVQMARLRSKVLFQSTPSVGRATVVVLIIYGFVKISIHALRGEGDDLHRRCSRAPRGHFNPRPPWGGRRNMALHCYNQQKFQSTPSVGRATPCKCVKFRDEKISIHALRGEGDILCRRLSDRSCHFNPRPPWGGRLIAPFEPCDIPAISIHALRGEGDWCGYQTRWRTYNFNPRPPWGGRLQKYTNMQCYACT